MLKDLDGFISINLICSNKIISRKVETTYAKMIMAIRAAILRSFMGKDPVLSIFFRKKPYT